MTFSLDPSEQQRHKQGLNFLQKSGERKKSCPAKNRPWAFGKSKEAKRADAAAGSLDCPFLITVNKSDLKRS